MLEIRRATQEDYEKIWPMLSEVFKRGETYPYSPSTTKEEAFTIWMDMPLATYVAIKDEQIVGTYYIKPNQPGLGSHVCNAGYIVSNTYSSQGIGRVMCEHALAEAKKLGFKAMQYNLVVGTNHRALQLWKSCGFEVIGVLPKAFNHLKDGFVDAYIMYQRLE